MVFAVLKGELDMTLSIKGKVGLKPITAAKGLKFCIGAVIFSHLIMPAGFGEQTNFCVKVIH